MKSWAFVRLDSMDAVDSGTRGFEIIGLEPMDFVSLHSRSYGFLENTNCEPIIMNS